MARYKANYKGIGRMLSSRGMQREMYNRANKVKLVAEATAPKDTGKYAESFEVESGIREGKTRRAYGRVTNDDPKAIDLEYGTKDTPKFRTLGKALEAAGD